MALTITEQFRGQVGGRICRGFQVTCDGSTGTITAANLDMNYIESVVAGSKANLTGTVTWELTGAAVADGAQAIKEVTVTGAALGDIVHLSLATNTQGMILSGEVTTTNLVRAVLQNETGSASLTVGDATLLAVVEKHIGFSTQSGTSIIFYPLLASADTFNIVVFGY